MLPAIPGTRLFRHALPHIFSFCQYFQIRDFYQYTVLCFCKKHRIYASHSIASDFPYLICSALQVHLLMPRNFLSLRPSDITIMAPAMMFENKSALFQPLNQFPSFHLFPFSLYTPIAQSSIIYTHFLHNRIISHIDTEHTAKSPK